MGAEQVPKLLPERFDGVLGRFDQGLRASGAVCHLVGTDIEAEEVEAFPYVPDAGLLLGEVKTAPGEKGRNPCPGLKRLRLSVADDDEVISIPHKDRAVRFHV